MPRVPQGRVTLYGTVSDGLDIWTMSFAIDPQASRTQAQMNQTASQIRVIFLNEVWTGAAISAYISDHTTFVGVRLDDVREPGGIVRQAVSDNAEPVTGGLAGSQLPPQIAEVISLRTGDPGRSRRGRMYFPPLGVAALFGDGTLHVSRRAELAQAMADFFTGVNGDAFVASTAFVASDVLQALIAINEVRVGDIFDTQRRRRNALDESYSVASVTI